MVFANVFNALFHLWSSKKHQSVFSVGGNQGEAQVSMKG